MICTLDIPLRTLVNAEDSKTLLEKQHELFDLCTLVKPGDTKTIEYRGTIKIILYTLVKQEGAKTRFISKCSWLTFTPL